MRFIVLTFLQTIDRRKYIGVLGLFYIINYYFEYRIRIRCIELNMGTWFKIYILIYFSFFFQKCPRSVNNSRTEHLG